MGTERDRLDDIVEAGLAALQPEAASINRFVQAVSSELKRSIVLLPWSLQPLRLFGFWVRCQADDESFDYIVYEQDTARVHQEHIILHEISHIILGHQTYTLAGGDRWDMRVLGRSIMRDNETEAAAEALATEIRAAIVDKIGIAGLTRSRVTAPRWDILVKGLAYE